MCLSLYTSNLISPPNLITVEDHVGYRTLEIVEVQIREKTWGFTPITYLDYGTLPLGSQAGERETSRSVGERMPSRSHEVESGDEQRV